MSSNLEGICNQRDTPIKTADIDHPSETVSGGDQEDVLADDRNAKRHLSPEYESARPKPETPDAPIGLSLPSFATQQDEQQAARRHPPSILRPTREGKNGNQNLEPGNISDGTKDTNIGTNSQPGENEQQTSRIHPLAHFGPQLEDKTRNENPEHSNGSGVTKVTDVGTYSKPREVIKFPEKYELCSMRTGGSRKHVGIIEIGFRGPGLPDECLESLGRTVHRYSTPWLNLDPSIKFIAAGRSSAREGETVPGEAWEQCLPRWEPVSRIYVPAPRRPGVRGSEYLTEHVQYPRKYILAATSLGPTIENAGIIEIAFRRNDDPLKHFIGLEYVVKDELQTWPDLSPTLVGLWLGRWGRFNQVPLSDYQGGTGQMTSFGHTAMIAKNNKKRTRSTRSESPEAALRKQAKIHDMMLACLRCSRDEPCDQSYPTCGRCAIRRLREFRIFVTIRVWNYMADQIECIYGLDPEPTEEGWAELNPEPTKEIWAERAARGLEAASIWLSESILRPSRQVYENHILEPIDQYTWAE
ncbi:hypothetical protein BKA61DRAFT_578453 [Leptodontidium sp. MPI-SDFR-AT-0119]|nr:hypothetical protein BKA61DRAFT_578453 [Leptodontidium sp. MPI-SDFR-AT-0119]